MQADTSQSGNLNNTAPYNNNSQSSNQNPTPVLTPFEEHFFDEEPFPYEKEMQLLVGMGFNSPSQLVWRLKKFKGNLEAVLDDLLRED